MVEHPVDRQPLAQHVGFALGWHRQGVAGTPGAPICGRAIEAAAGLDQLHHRCDHRQHIALNKQLTARPQRLGQGQQQGGLQHPPLLMLLLKPGIRKLDRHALQQPGGQGR